MAFLYFSILSHFTFLCKCASPVGFDTVGKCTGDNFGGHLLCYPYTIMLWYFLQVPRMWLWCRAFVPLARISRAYNSETVPTLFSTCVRSERTTIGYLFGSTMWGACRVCVGAHILLHLQDTFSTMVRLKYTALPIASDTSLYTPIRQLSRYTPYNRMFVIFLFSYFVMNLQGLPLLQTAYRKRRAL